MVNSGSGLICVAVAFNVFVTEGYSDYSVGDSIVIVVGGGGGGVGGGGVGVGSGGGGGGARSRCPVV